MKRGWDIIAFNPPGSQGTFTIPNPLKDGSYRGQTGSESPDIIALKANKTTNIIIIVECKPLYKSSDIIKLKNLFSNKERLNLFLYIIDKQCVANNIKFDKSLNSEIILAKAHGGKPMEADQVLNFNVIVDYSTWNPNNFPAKLNLKNICKIISSSAFLKY